MKEHIQKAKDWWSNLATRERRMVSIGGGLSFIFIFYQLMWSPYINYVNDLRDRLVSQQKTLAWMQAADIELSRSKNVNSRTPNKTTPIVLLSLLKKQINQFGLSQSLKQLKQSSTDSIEIQFQKVNFDKMISLLIETLDQQAVSITQMTVSADKDIGVVNANLILKS